METVSLLLTPADVTMFRDTRPFDQVPTGARSLLPSPRTAAGAIRTWALRTRHPHDFAKLRGKATTPARVKEVMGQAAAWITEARFAGPFLHRYGNTFWPAPLSVVRLDGDPRPRQLRPLVKPPPGWVLPASTPDLKPLWATGVGEAEPLAGLLDNQGMARFLHCQCDQLVETDTDRVWRHEPRIGIGVDSGRGAVESGALYGSSFLRLEQGVAFRVDVTSGQGLRAELEQAVLKRPWLRLGGEGKVAGISLLQEQPALPTAPAWPPRDGRFCTYLATPARFEGGSWLPRALMAKHTLISAVVGRPEAVPGWDVASGRPLPTAYAVPAGAVYYWEVRDQSATDPHGLSISDNADDQAVGWGICMRGEWDYV